MTRYSILNDLVYINMHRSNAIALRDSNIHKFASTCNDYLDLHNQYAYDQSRDPHELVMLMYQTSRWIPLIIEFMLPVREVVINILHRGAADHAFEKLIRRDAPDMSVYDHGSKEYLWGLQLRDELAAWKRGCVDSAFGLMANPGLRLRDYAHVLHSADTMDCVNNLMRAFLRNPLNEWRGELAKKAEERRREIYTAALVLARLRVCRAIRDHVFGMIWSIDFSLARL